MNGYVTDILKLTTSYYPKKGQNLHKKGQHRPSIQMQGSDQAWSFLNGVLLNNIKGQIHQKISSIKDKF